MRVLLGTIGRLYGTQTPERHLASPAKHRLLLNITYVELLKKAKRKEMQNQADWF